MKKEKGDIYELYSPILSPDLHEKERIRASQQTLKATLLRLSEERRREENRRERETRSFDRE
jgi:hypothetical protein